VAARFTSVPWDQLGYSQVDNALLMHLAPWTGVYGITFLIVAANAMLAAAYLPAFKQKRIFAYAGVVLMLVSVAGLLLKPAAPAATDTALLVQPNLDVAGDNLWNDTEWVQQMVELNHRAAHPCASAQYIAGIPELSAATVNPPCDPARLPSLIAWPESPAPFFEPQKKFQDTMGALATTSHASLFIGGVGVDFNEPEHVYNFYNSAIVFSPDGHQVGRYDKIHLVPYGEYIPFQSLFSFAHKLTGRVSSMSRGEERKVFRLNGHRYASFICYEAVFADEIRHFARLGGEVFVNVSDDGWYGDTSAPWQHFNMLRMRAIENRRWILRDTNNGVTASVDPYGTVRQSIPRHEYGALLANFGYSDELTFYTEHGDVFAWFCAILSFGLIGWAVRRQLRQN
jgi:apolipoprotein N-acyltransferase